MHLWRIYRKVHGSGLDGTGGLFASGRWNKLGHRVVYFSDTPSLTVLEKLVHLEIEFIGGDYLLGAFEMRTGTSIPTVEEFSLFPSDWLNNAEATAECGTKWLIDSTASLLSVPSAIIPEQRNFLMNPLHPDSAQLQLVRERPFEFDMRLIGSRI